jgi:hypothetical protein
VAGEPDGPQVLLWEAASDLIELITVCHRLFRRPFRLCGESDLRFTREVPVRSLCCRHETIADPKKHENCLLIEKEFDR